MNMSILLPLYIMKTSSPGEIVFGYLLADNQRLLYMNPRLIPKTIEKFLGLIVQASALHDFVKGG